MYPSIIEFIALVLLIGGYWHAARYEGRSFAQPWFTAGYLTAFIRETLNQIIFQVYVFAPSVIRLGSAPALITLLSAGVAYLAYAFARRFIDPSKPALMAGLLFLITASIALPIEATGTLLRWWYYPEVGHTFFGGVPLAAPFVWGGGAALFYVFFWRIHQTRLPERGRLYAMISLSPIMAVGQLLLTMLLNV
jgi:hypothetical protein